MIYEVGERIDMIAKLIADFDDDGWCYVSFAVVTDLGPVFSDAYYISPSMDTRYLSSFYDIVPDDTSPGSGIATAYIIFNLEIFDKYSQSISETIEVNITRGHLTINPLNTMTVEYGDNTTLDFRITSSFNSDIVSANQPVLIEVYDANSTQVLKNSTITNLFGDVQLQWDSSMGSPGEYNINISSNATNAFLPVSESFTFDVQLPSSKLVLVSHTESVFCQSPDGSIVDSAEIVVDHFDQKGLPIEESLVQWTTDFSNGTMTDIGNGRFQADISFLTTPGLTLVNLTALNSYYQMCTSNVTINVLPRNISIDVESTSAICDSLLQVYIEVSDWQSDIGIESIPMNVSFIVGTTIQSIIGTSNSSGIFSGMFSVPETSWGVGEIHVFVEQTTYYHEQELSLYIDVFYTPSIDYEITVTTTIGQNVSIQVNVTNPIGQPIQGLSISIHDSLNISIVEGYSSSDGSIILTWLITTDYGLHNFTIYVNQNFSLNSIECSEIINLQVYYPLYFLPANETWYLIRGTNTTVEFFLDSNYTTNQTVSLILNDSLMEFSIPITTFPDSNTITSISLGYNISTGLREIIVTVLDKAFHPLGKFTIITIIQSVTESNIANITGYYSEELLFDISSINDNNETIVEISILIYLVGYETPIAEASNTSTLQQISLNLPSWIVPGSHTFLFVITSEWSIIESQFIEVFIWMPTSINIIIIPDSGGELLPISPTQQQSLTQLPDINLSISSGSIINPPPILFNGTTSIEFPTTLETSLTSCPKLSSGTNNLSTVLLNSLIALSGNGQTVLSLSDLAETSVDFSAITSSTDLQVLPNETIPQSAVEGPDKTTSVRYSVFS